MEEPDDSQTDLTTVDVVDDTSSPKNMEWVEVGSSKRKPGRPPKKTKTKKLKTLDLLAEAELRKSLNDTDTIAHVTEYDTQSNTQKQTRADSEADNIHKLQNQNNNNSNQPTTNNISNHGNHKHYISYKNTFLIKTHADLTRLEFVNIWSNTVIINPNSDLIIRTKIGIILKSNLDRSVALEELIKNKTIDEFKLETNDTRPPSILRTLPKISYSLILRYVEKEIHENDVALALTSQGYNFSYCKRIIAKATNKPTLLIRLITSDLSSNDKLLSAGYLFLKNRAYSVIPSNPPKPIPQACGKCASFEHTTVNCSEPRKCSKCLGPHDTSLCSSLLPTRCIACNSDDHSSWSLKCPRRPTTPIPGIPNVPIVNINKKSNELEKKTTESRIHAPLTMHDFVLHTITLEINHPAVTNREELLKRLRKRFIQDFQIDTQVVFSGNRMYVLMFDLLAPNTDSPTETNDNTKQFIATNEDGV